MNITAMILASGRSRRMQRCKALIPYGAGTLIHELVDRCEAFDIKRVIVTVGSLVPRSNLLSANWVREHLPPIVQPVLGAPDGSVADSIANGLKHIPDGHTVLLWPVSNPFASIPLLRALKRLHSTSAQADQIVTAPSHENATGYPLLVGPIQRSALVEQSSENGLQAVVESARAKDRLLTFPTEDARITQSLQNPDDIKRWFS